MKKVLTILLGMILVISMICCVSAAPTEIKDTETGGSGLTKVTLSLSEKYTIKIPDQLSITEMETGVFRGKAEISGKIFMLDPGSSVNVTISSEGASYDSGSWYLTNSKDSNEKIPYFINVDGHVDPNAPSSPITPGMEVFSLSSEDYAVAEFTSAEIHCRLMDTNFSSSGDFTDNLKFVVELRHPLPSP